METLVLEQYMRVLYPEIHTWVKERNPVTAAEAASFVEAYIVTRKGSSGILRNMLAACSLIKVSLGD